MKRRVAGFMQREGIFPHGPVVVGLSGGADSVALLSLLRSMEIPCVAVHCHFGLRDDEADRDLAHSEAVAARLGTEFEAVRFNTRALMAKKGISAEMACRELRYDHFEAVRQRVGAEFIAVAHHRDDNIETLFLNLLRGSGIHGLRGMLPRNGRVIRPLLEVSRTEILEYLDAEGLDFVTDSTNLCSDFSRNRLRNRVLPALYEAFPSAPDAITLTLANLRGNEALYNSLLPASPGLEQIRQSASPETLIHEFLSPLGFNSTQTADMLSARSGSVFTSPTHRVEISHGSLEISRLDAPAPPKPRLEGRIIARPADFKPQPGILYLDSAALDGHPRWELRPAQTGDRMRPFGMKGTRLLSDIFTDAGLSPSQKRSQWVLTRDGIILWAIGLRTSAYFPVKSDTCQIIEIHEKSAD